MQIDSASIIFIIAIITEFCLSILLSYLLQRELKQLLNTYLNSQSNSAQLVTAVMQTHPHRISMEKLELTAPFLHRPLVGALLITAERLQRELRPLFSRIAGTLSSALQLVQVSCLLVGTVSLARQDLTILPWLAVIAFSSHVILILAGLSKINNLRKLLREFSPNLDLHTQERNYELLQVLSGSFASWGIIMSLLSFLGLSWANRFSATEVELD